MVEAEKIKGIVVEPGVKASELVKRMRHCGLQAGELAKAVEVIKEMKRDGATVFLTFTSNMVSSGLRELFAQLVREKFIDCIITGIGSVMAELARKYPRHETLEIYRMLKERKEGEKIVMVGRLMAREKSNLPDVAVFISLHPKTDNLIKVYKTFLEKTWPLYKEYDRVINFTAGT
jgi:deoxyhypusine synthase